MAVYDYINSIRNLAKRDYARRYWTWLVRGGRGEPPEYAISTMAAQAVRMRLRVFESYAN